ncbi:hypothetical protein jhhlp_004996 [Lomentospora prolificans]|uniref:Glycosyltransferase family 32 protein n=1 Tax=Lomentospora prolificans TaxID=41688 RepID=A0A2N3N835_9PEZI|nr:hypothetical protein jhhlp_004996 [Lomentospora prolificans]
MASSPPLLQHQQQAHGAHRFYFAYLRRHRRRIAILIIITTLLYHFFFISGPLSQINGPRPTSRKITPERDLDAQPHYIHRSEFRANPDVAYEEKLDNALLDLERRVLADVGSGGVAHEKQRKLWQILLGPTAQRGADSMLFEEKNPEWDYTVLRDVWANNFVNATFSTIPDLVTLYHEYPYDVLRADLLRYLVLWFYGGYYADTDIKPARPIDACPSLKPVLPPHADRPNISLVIGIEIDEPWASSRLMRQWHWIRTYGFVQYNLYAPQRFSPLLRRAIVRVLAHTKRHHAKSWLFGPRYDEKTILEITGPGVFTDAILDVLSETLPPTHPFIQQSLSADAEVGDLSIAGTRQAKRQRVTWAPFHHLEQPLWVDATEAAEGKSFGGLGVLPINVWGNGQRHSGAENFRSRQACVNHRFKGTWKKTWWQRWRGI